MKLSDRMQSLEHVVDVLLKETALMNAQIQANTEMLLGTSFEKLEKDDYLKIVTKYFDVLEGFANDRLERIRGGLLDPSIIDREQDILHESLSNQKVKWHSAYDGTPFQNN